MFEGIFRAFTLSDGSNPVCVPVCQRGGLGARLPADLGDPLGQRPAQKDHFTAIGGNSRTGCRGKFRHDVGKINEAHYDIEKR